MIPTGLGETVEAPGDWSWIWPPRPYRPLPAWSQVLSAVAEVLEPADLAPAC